MVSVTRYASSQTRLGCLTTPAELRELRRHAQDEAISVLRDDRGYFYEDACVVRAITSQEMGLQGWTIPDMMGPGHSVTFAGAEMQYSQVMAIYGVMPPLAPMGHIDSLRIGDGRSRYMTCTRRMIDCGEFYAQWAAMSITPKIIERIASEGVAPFAAILLEKPVIVRPNMGVVIQGEVARPVRAMSAKLVILGFVVEMEGMNVMVQDR